MLGLQTRNLKLEYLLSVVLGVKYSFDLFYFFFNLLQLVRVLHIFLI